MAQDIDNDDYVANLLRRDAKNTSKKYEMVGLGAFLPRDSTSKAPKPNTRFLRNILRETDSHNAALLAKEAEESRARLKEMNREKERQRDRAGRLTPPDLSEDGDRARSHRKRRRDDSEDEERHRKRERRKRTNRNEEEREYRSRREGEREMNRRGEKSRRYEDTGDEDESQRSRHSRPDRKRERRYRYSSDLEESRTRHKGDSSRSHRRRRSYSNSRSRSASPHSRRHHKPSRRRRHDLRSPRRISTSSELEHSTIESSKQNGRTTLPPASLDSDSDPLEAIVGPLPPPSDPIIRSRGRGAYKANSMAMDARFSSTYDPATDVQVDSDIEDDWGDALEAFRDRQRWKQQGAERLKAAGFTDEQVKKWGEGGERTEGDVVWAKKGEGREWDRGKVMDEDGTVDLKAEWGRLT
ncbi:hypothetical protein K469DRAFT_723330 [Zopfia rhizophila CBS 207.26]|uniref:Pre-mRNA-splicing factor 38B n=1 Tax=Zopfia rhizophila CBS 207.26 TaxID=1314779 RepID=A0A6A6D9S6_9PEZI|nr:hypothetical protein K469DRAFT_723330 [Zopfia rhizophila CBS 207.26]